MWQDQDSMQEDMDWGCGAATAAVTEQVKIPAVTALYAENSGTDLYKDRAHIYRRRTMLPRCERQ